MNDPLAAFRRKPIESKANAATEPEDYLAFDGKDRVECLKIHRVKGPIRSPVYAFLLDVAYDAEGTYFVIIYNFMVVTVYGQNLRTVVRALQDKTADFIQEYDPKKWPEPTDKTAAFIDTIEVEVKAIGDSMAEAERVRKAAIKA